MGLHPDARITILGGVPIGVAVIAVAAACDNHVLAHTGGALTAAAVVVALAIDHADPVFNG